MRSESFRDQVAIITGASSGIGRALAMQLASQGAKVVFAARRADQLEQTAVECRQLGGEALVIPTDVSDEAQCKDLVAHTIEKYGRLDLLVNNAGLAASGLLEEFPSLDLFKYTMAVNFFGTVYCTYHALPHLIKTRGRIVAISSLGGKAALPYNTPYISSKYAMHGFCDSLRMELVRHGVSVTVICPSWVVTGFHEAQMNKDGVKKGPRGRSIYSKNTMTAERCAELCLRAAYKRWREVLMPPGHLAAWLKLLAPGFLDWLTIKVFLGSAIRRVRRNQEEEKS